MSESCYNEIFETIKSNLVPKKQYEECQLEKNHLNSELENAKEELKNMKLKYEEEKLKNDIIQAEKECLESEKKTLDLKLKLKTNQYNSLLLSGKTDCIPAVSALIPTVPALKEEPSEIGTVNVPASSSSSIGTKRTSSFSANDQRQKAKRKKTTRSDSTTRNTRKSTQNERKFTCEDCIDLWGGKIEADFGGNPDHKDAPNPRQSISVFSSFQAFKTHSNNVHGYDQAVFCDEKNCSLYRGHNTSGWYGGCAPHGENICRICDLSFKFKKHLDRHVATGHADHDMTNKQFYDLYLKYKDSDHWLSQD